MTKKEQLIEQIVSMETIYIAGGCLWGTRVLKTAAWRTCTQAGRANEATKSKQPMMVMQNVSKQALTLRLFQLKIYYFFRNH
jgi:peptide methionine sulfoxide reductase MsrA